MSAVKRILVPTDFSEPARSAVAFSARFAAELSAEVVLLHVIEPHKTYFVSPGASLYLPESLEIRRHVDRELEGSLEAVRKHAPARAVVAKGPAFSEIVAAARSQKADLIVMGAYGAGRFMSALFGSTVSRVLHDAPCPVLVHREGPRVRQVRVTKARSGSRGPRRARALAFHA